jgi:IS4 transposase
MIGYYDPETVMEYLVTSADHLKVKIIADLYTERWQIELFFKWIMKNLRIKTFLGTSKDAVLIKIWIALCVYLLLAFFKFNAKLGVSVQQMLRLLQLNLFERRNMIEFFKPPEYQHSDFVQFSLWTKL